MAGRVGLRPRAPAPMRMGTELALLKRRARDGLFTCKRRPVGTPMGILWESYEYSTKHTTVVRRLIMHI